MKSPQNLIKILLCLLIAYSEATEFKYTTTLQCDIGSASASRWCYLIKFYEEDVFAVDFMGRTAERCQESSQVVDEFVGRLGERDGILDYTFEPFMEIHHNCTEKGDIQKIRHTLEPVPAGLEIYVKDNLHFNLRTSEYKEV